MHNFQGKMHTSKKYITSSKDIKSCIPQSAGLQGFNQKLHISSIFWLNSKVHIIKDYTTEGCIARGIAVYRSEKYFLWDNLQTKSKFLELSSKEIHGRWHASGFGS